MVSAEMLSSSSLDSLNIALRRATGMTAEPGVSTSTSSRHNLTPTSISVAVNRTELSVASSFTFCRIVFGLRDGATMAAIENTFRKGSRLILIFTLGFPLMRHAVECSLIDYLNSYLISVLVISPRLLITRKTECLTR